MAEYVLAEGDNLEQVVQGLIAKADDPGDVVWSPRPDVPHGGVYVIPDALAAKVTAQADAESADEEAGETPDEEAEDAADESVVDDPATPEDEHVAAQDRVAARRAARKAAASSVTEKSE